MSRREISKIKLANGTTMHIRPYPTGKEVYQGPDLSLTWMPDGPEYYAWWQMPLFWFRVLIHKFNVWRGKYD